MPQTFPQRREFIAMIAITMMVVAFAIDTMLPALPRIASDLGARGANDQQFVLTAFTIGMGVATFIAGILSDSLGRRRLLLTALVGYVACGIGAALAPGFTALLAARFAQGLAAGGASVVAGATVRDRYAGREMARINSLTSVVFMAAPIIAPTLGVAVLAFSGWRAIFVVLALFGLVLVAWIGWRLPETLARANRVPLHPAQVLASARTVMSNRAAVGYTIALMLIQTTIFGYLATVQQAFDQVFGRAELLPVGFAIMATGIAIGSLVNSRIVMRLGMRRIGHAGLIFFVAVAATHLAVVLAGHSTVVSFIALQSMMMLGFSTSVGNFSALAMNDMGAVAGTASSLQRSFSTIVSAVIGTLIGQQFDGTLVPLYVGVTAASALALAVVFWVERGHLFDRGAQPMPSPAE